MGRETLQKPCKLEVYPECMAQESIQLLCHRQDHHEPPLNAKRLVSTWALPALCTPGMWEQTHLHTVYLAGTMSIICAGNSSTHSCLDDCLKIFGSSPSPPQKKCLGTSGLSLGTFTPAPSNSTHPSPLRQIIIILFCICATDTQMSLWELVLSKSLLYKYYGKAPL